MGLYLEICRVSPALQIEWKHWDSTLSECWSILDTVFFGIFHKSGPVEVEIRWNSMEFTRFGIHLRWLAQRGISESHQLRRDWIWIFHLQSFRSEKPRGVTEWLMRWCHGRKAYLFRKIYATQRVPMISKKQKYYNMYTNINYTLRISDWTLQKEGVWICVVGRVLLDLQTTSY